MPETGKDPALIEAVIAARRVALEADTDWRAAVAAAAAGGWTQEEIGKPVGLTKQRIGQMLRHAPTGGRLLLAPDPAPALVCVIERVEKEKGHPAITASTMKAADRLIDLAGSFGLEMDRQTIPVGGLDLNLNRPNLVVMFGPRSSPLLAMAISAEPVIGWRADEHGDWYITDSKTGAEYHSQFDRSVDPDVPWPRLCYAHIGRIRRPDWNGSWLCLAGAHAPGVAGATEYLCREIGGLWDQARQALWSAVVEVTVDQDGTILGVELATPVYVHGNR